MGQTAAIALLNGKYFLKNTHTSTFSAEGIIKFFLVSVMHFERQGDNEKLCIT